MRIIAQRTASPGRHTQHSRSQAQYTAARQSMNAAHSSHPLGLWRDSVQFAPSLMAGMRPRLS